MSTSTGGTRYSTRTRRRPENYNPSAPSIPAESSGESQAASKSANHDLGPSSSSDATDDHDGTYNEPEESEVGTSDSSEDELPFCERRPKANSLKSLNRVVDENWGPYLNAEEDQLSNPAWLSEHGYADGPPSDVGHVGGFFVCSDLSVYCSVVSDFSEISGFILILSFFFVIVFLVILLFLKIPRY